jgi:hypothetical protein
MASGTFDKNNNTESRFQTTTTHPSPNDDDTEMAGKSRGKNEAEEAEFNVKWQIPVTYDATSAKRTLIQLMFNLLVTHPGKVTIIDNKKREWNYIESEGFERFEKECENMSINVHPIKNKQQKVIRWIAITTIVSSSTIQDWKDNEIFYMFMQEAEAYLFPHHFPCDQWEVTSIGFIKDIHAVHYPKDLLHKQINNMIEPRDTPTPQFQLVPQRITTKDKKASTKAYTVQCLKTDAHALTYLLTHGAFRSPPNQIFVPFKYKSTKPEIFMSCIRQQNEVYYKTWIIKVEGLTPEAMEFIKHDILQIMGVMHIVPSKRLADIGEWKILTDQSKCAYIHRQLTDIWPTIISKIPPNVLERSPNSFSTPAISSKRAREYQENESDDDSYGSLLTTGTDVSTMTNDDASLNELPEAYQYPTYASAAASKNTAGTETPISSPTNSTNPDWYKEKLELESQIKAQAKLIEMIQSDLQEKVSRSKDLEDKLEQAIELAHTRDQRHAEMLSKFAELMGEKKGHKQAHQSSHLHDNQMTPSPSTPDRHHHVEDAPPPKKANTNASPHRHLYTLFRPPTTKNSQPRQKQSGRALSSKEPSSKDSSLSILNQPMETDDDPRQPTPGGQSGNQQK